VEVNDLKIVISGFYGLDNIGDEAILATIVDILKKELDDPRLTVFSFSPTKTSSTYDVNSLYRGWRRDNWKKIKAIKNADLVISGGGGLLQDVYPTRVISGPLPYYLLIVLIAKLLRKKVMFFSQGIGPVETSYGKWLMRRFANLADVVTVRDNYSANLLKRLGVTKPKTEVTSDIVFAFEKETDHECYDSLPLHGNEKLIGVSVRPWFTDDTYCKRVANLLDNLIVKKGVTPVFIPMENHHDYKVSEKVLTYMNNKDACHLLGTNFSPNQYLNFIEKCELVIGMRLHSLIFATIAHVPHIGISYDKKVENLLKINGMWEFSTHLEDINPDQLFHNAEHLMENSSNYNHSLKLIASQLKKDALRNIDILKENFIESENQAKSLVKESKQ
jgi:polysaccharide pyruvyl transferase CsaB